MENNKAIVCHLGNITKIEGADKIVKADVILNDIPLTSVVVGVDTPEGQPVVYFDSNMVLVDAFIENIDRLSPDYGKEGFRSIGAYLGKGGRVKCIRPKQTISNGLAIELSKFEKLFPKNPLKEGDSFTDIGTVHICHKYVVPIKTASQNTGKKGRKGKQNESKMIPGFFNFHYDTQQLARNAFRLNPNEVWSISRKIHGTSFVAGNNLTKRKLSFIKKLGVKLGVNIPTTEYSYVHASRSVVKNDALNPGGFYKEDIWTLVGKKFFEGKLYQGETVYGEIVGYLPSGGFIQKNYDYGCLPGTYKIAVYRMTKIGPDGHTIEYSWNQIKNRCAEMGVPMVEEYFHGRLRDLFPDIPVDDKWTGNFIARLKFIYLEKDAVDNLCKKVPDEGIVLKPDNGISEAYKLKSERFFEHETKMAESGNDENAEDEA